MLGPRDGQDLVADLSQALAALVLGFLLGGGGGGDIEGLQYAGLRGSWFPGRFFKP